MPTYRVASQDFHFEYRIPEMETFETKSETQRKSPASSSLVGCLIARTEGWVGSAQRSVEVYETLYGMLLKVGDNQFFITAHGETISKQNSQKALTQLDREIILGPALVLALALRGTWSLHASAAMYKENVIVFLGESGLGKSTLAAYLAQNPEWRLVADDILPVKIDSNDVNVLPHFPQLKLPVNSQPSMGLPENLILKTICVLTHAEPSQMPELQKIPTAQTVQALLSHIAGTRMFGADLLAKHLKFSTQAAKQIPAYRLIHPHRRDTLPLVKDFLENIC